MPENTNYAPLGKTGIRPRGNYIPATQYEKLDLVHHNFAAYLSLKDTAAEPSDDGVNWMLIAEGADIATVEKAGKVKPDGTTITIDADGTLHGTPQVPDSVVFTDSEATEETTEIPRDADTLGGQAPEYYMAREELETSRPALYALNTVEEIDAFYDTHSGGIPDNSWYRACTWHSVSHPVLTGGKLYLTGFKADSDYEWQEATKYQAKTRWLRVKRGGTWGEWRNVMTNDMVSNPDILINGNFKINQRGLTHYESVQGQSVYTADRWRLEGHAGDAVDILGNGIRFKTSVYGHEMRYYVENHGEYAGKALTLSCKINQYSGEFRLAVHDGVSTRFITMDKAGVHSVTINVASGATQLIVSFVNSSQNTDASIDIEWVKLEPGETATPFTPPDPSAELMKCVRYGVPMVFIIGEVAYMTSDVIDFVLPFPVRIPPTLLGVANTDIRVEKLGSAAVVQSGFEFSVLKYHDTLCVVRAKKAGHGLDRNVRLVLEKGYDAEMY